MRNLTSPLLQKLSSGSYSYSCSGVGAQGVHLSPDLTAYPVLRRGLRGSSISATRLFGRGKTTKRQSDTLLYENRRSHMYIEGSHTQLANMSFEKNFDLHILFFFLFSFSSTKECAMGGQAKELNVYPS